MTELRKFLDEKETIVLTRKQISFLLEVMEVEAEHTKNEDGFEEYSRKLKSLIWNIQKQIEK